MTYYGIDDAVLSLLKNYLNNCKQYVEIEEIKSEILPVAVDVPQGSILGPLLLIININDFSQASSKLKFIMYADDTTLFSTLTSFSDNTQDNTIESFINADLSKVVEWLNINKLSLNKTKSKHMIFYVPSKGIHSLTLKIDNTNIGKVDEFNFLGFTLDSKLNLSGYNSHTEPLIKQLNLLKIEDQLKLQE